ncbi:MAG: tRNA (adenosine(37)-N6)-dimethylallyltransferase MiaA, partial [Phycisphaerales bacterium]
MLPAFPVIVGPTGGGKSALALALAGRVRRERGVVAEIVSADSMQVYRGMDIGTAKATRAERDEVVHHLIDIVEPEESFGVDRWLGLCERAIEGIRARGGVPIVIGGTHFYVKALLEGLFEGPSADAGVRAELEAMDAEARWALLREVDPPTAERVHRNDVRRVVRALEVHRLTGRAISEQQEQWDRGGRRGDAFIVGLEWSTEAINRRINARVRRMVADGLVEEVRGLVRGGRLGVQAREALG